VNIHCKFHRDEIIKDGVFHGQLMFTNPRGRILAPDQRTWTQDKSS